MKANLAVITSLLILSGSAHAMEIVNEIQSKIKPVISSAERNAVFLHRFASHSGKSPNLPKPAKPLSRIENLITKEYQIARIIRASS